VTEPGGPMNESGCGVLHSLKLGEEIAW